MDFYSMLLARKLKKESGGDVTIESLVVTENGNYSETGKAYSPVVVNIPFPENGYLLKSASGQAINISDGAPLYLQECKAEIESVQEGSGDPSPTNIRPISGQTEVNVTRCGKNLFDKENIRRGVRTRTDGTTQSGSETNNFSSQFIRVRPTTPYSITMFDESYENGSLFVVYYDKYKNGLNQIADIQRLVSNESKTFTTPSNAHYIVVSGYRGSGTDIFTSADTMVCEGTPTTYAPYNGKTYTIQLGETIYGGELDVVTGELTVTHEIVDLGDLSWTLSDGFFRTNELIATVKKPINNQTMVNAISSIYPIMTWADISATDTAIAVSVAGQMIVGNPNITSVADFVTAVSGQSLVYELAEPYTIQLTPQQIRLLEGTNNLSCNAGDLNIEYLGKGVN